MQMGAACLVTVIHGNNELLKEPSSFILHQCTVICSVVPFNVVYQIPTRGKLTDYPQVLGCQEDLMQLHNVGMHAA